MHVHVFYIDPRSGWCSQLRDEIGSQIGDAVYSYRKASAIFEAKRWNLRVEVYGKNGLWQRSLNTPTKG